MHALVKTKVRMFTNNQRQEERTGKHGTPRLQYLQELVSQFQNATDEETKERIVANLANFAYDPYNYTILRQLNVLELFVDCITEPNEKLVEFGIGGICNASAEPKNCASIVEADGIALIIKCLSSPVRNTVKYALGAMYYMCDYNRATRGEIVRPEVVDLIERYAAAESVNEKLYQWIWRQQGGSRVTPMDIINYIQNELECCIEEPPVSPRAPPPQPTMHVTNSGLMASSGTSCPTTVPVARSEQCENQAKNSVFLKRPFKSDTT